MAQARIARFEKVSWEQFFADWKKVFSDAVSDPAELSEEKIRVIYDGIKLPRRATAGSAGYDFFLPVDLSLSAGEGALIPTGIRVKMDPAWVLCCFPRSGLGFKYRLQLDNTVGIIDADYYGSDNEGHMFTKVTCDARTDRRLDLAAGDAFMQAVFLPYGLTEDDDAANIRNGGFGSTDS